MERRGGAKPGRRRPASARAHTTPSSRRLPSIKEGAPAASTIVQLFRRDIPTYPTPLIGRGRELSAIQDLLSRADVRLVTLTGAPGVGKTRLALELASLMAGRYAHGAAFVDLAPLMDSRTVLPRTLNALGIREVGGDVLTQLLRALRKKTLLIVLDNFEHVLDAAAPIAEIINHCPHLKILVTSRTPLRLRCEHQFPVHALALPDLRAPPVPAEIANVPSVALFLERAQAGNPDFRLTTSHDALAVAGICIRLDGLPLAIELAAVHTHDLPVRTIWEHLARPWDQDSLRLLAGTIADLPARHRTLFAAIAWTYHLLPPDSQTLFRRLAVFAGGFGIDAVRDVCLDDELKVDPLDGVGTLLSHHLLQRELPTGDLRYRLLQTVREFALAQLHMGEEAHLVRRRHAEYFLSLAEQAEPHLWGREQIAWLDRLELDFDNFRAALDWSLTASDDDMIARRLGGALGRFWDLAGHWDEGLRWLDRLLAVAKAPSRQSIEMLVARAYNSFVRADYRGALAFLDEARIRAQVLNDPWGLVFSRIGAGAVQSAQGDLPHGMALLEEAAHLGQEMGVKGAVASAFSFMGVISILQGDLERADLATQQSLIAAQEEGNPHQLQNGLFVRGLTLLITTRLRQSLATFQESLRTALAMKEKMSIALSLEGVGWAAVALGHGELGAKIMAGADALRENLGGVESNVPTWRIYHDAAMERARKLLGESAFDDAWAAGNTLPIDQAIMLGLTNPRELSREASRLRTQRGNLSLRELDVVADITQGLTNGQIAAKLTISKRTVDFHVQNILNKLGFFSRTQIAAWAVEHGFKKTAS